MKSITMCHMASHYKTSIESAPKLSERTKYLPLYIFSESL